jgi:UDP-glucuronate decarboxylase
VAGIIAMMNGADDFVGPVNLGNPGEFTIRQLAELTIELTDSKSKLIEKPLPVDDPERRRPDITLAKQHLHWEPTVPLAEGLAKTIDWFRSVNMADFRAPTPNW